MRDGTAKLVRRVYSLWWLIKSVAQCSALTLYLALDGDLGCLDSASLTSPRSFVQRHQDSNIFADRMRATLNDHWNYIALSRHVAVQVASAVVA